MTILEKIKNGILTFINFLVLPSAGNTKLKLRRYILYFSIVVILNVIAGKNITHLGYPLSSNISVFLLLNINIILIIVILLMIFRNLVKILSEQQGSLKVKLLLFSLSIAIFPVVIVFIYSTQLLNENFNKWFANQVDGIVNKSSILVNDFRKYEQQSLNNYLFYFQAMLTEKELFAEDKIKKYNNDICRYVYNDVLTSIIIFDSSNNIILSCNNSYDTYLLEKLITHRLDLINDKYMYGYENIARGIHWAGAYTDDNSSQQGGLLVLKYTTPKLYEDLSAIERDARVYNQNLYFSYPVKNSSIMQLLQISLLILFSAIWVSILFARSITRPMEELAKASQKIADGNFDVNIKGYYGGEIGNLVIAFNSMVSQIKLYTAELSSKNEILSGMFEQISRDNMYIDAIFKNVDSSIILLSSDFQILKSNMKADIFISNYNESYNNIVLNKVREFINSTSDEIIENFDLLDKKGNKIFLISLSKIMLEDEHQILILLSDITEAIDSQKIALWKNIATNIAHEVKNPLTPIKLMAERVKRRVLKMEDAVSREIINECMDIIIMESDNLKELIEEFNMFARLPKADKHNINLLTLVNEVVSLYKETYRNITFNIDCNNQIYLNVDRLQIRRVFQNIILNAIHIIGVNEGMISIEVIEVDNKIEIYIRDNGCGISDNDILDIFKPYFSKRQGGTGLGLAIVKKIVEEHEGLIIAGNNIDKGAFFKITLPRGL